MRKPELKRPFTRPELMWDYDIKIGLQVDGWGAWTGLIWLRIGTGGGLVFAVMNLRVPYNARNFFTS
jgi:hypothetical protein